MERLIFLSCCLNGRLCDPLALMHMWDGLKWTTDFPFIMLPVSGLCIDYFRKHCTMTFLEFMSFGLQFAMNNNTFKRQISLYILGLYSSYTLHPVFPFLGDFHSWGKIRFISVCCDICCKFINKREEKMKLIIHSKESISILPSIYMIICREIFWRRQWHPTPVLLPGKSHGRRSLVGCSPWGR